MPEFVEPAVRHLRDSDSHDRVRLLVGCGGDRDELGERLRALDVERVDEVGNTTLCVELPASEAGRLWALDGVRSIEPDDTAVEAQGNS
jgi:hypothetical protein